MSNNLGFIAGGILCKAFFSSVARSACGTEKMQQIMRDKPGIIMQRIICVRDVILETGSREEVCRAVSVFMGKMYSFNEIRDRLNVCDVGVK